jgi:hypothetical protein
MAHYLRYYQGAKEQLSFNTISGATAANIKSDQLANLIGRNTNSSSSNSAEN